MGGFCFMRLMMLPANPLGRAGWVALPCIRPRMRDANPDGCEGGEFATFGLSRDGFDRYQQGPNQLDDLWIIDVDGSIVIVDAMYRPDTPAELVDEMRSIVESATFE